MNTINPPESALLKLMRCPISHSGLELVSDQRLAELNQKLSAGQLKDRLGRTIERLPLESALQNENGSYAYCVKLGIIKLIADEAIDLTAT